jgi:hypothetical protein
MPQFRYSRPLAIGALAGAASIWAARDYRAWRALGVGGLPPNIGGWVQVTVMRFRSRDPLTSLKPTQGPVTRILLDLPPRDGNRPTVAPHPVPHRVLDQQPTAHVRGELKAIFDEFASLTSPALEYRTSRWEKHNDALRVRGDGCEVGHIHPTDGSMHMTLNPADAQLVVERGWGEFHPLAGIMFNLPETYTLIYPPRTSADINQIRRILIAAVIDATGVEPIQV